MGPPELAKRLLYLQIEGCQHHRGTGQKRRVSINQIDKLAQIVQLSKTQRCQKSL